MDDPVTVVSQEVLVRPLTLVAFGGNALIEADDLGTTDEQVQRAETFADTMVEILQMKHDLLLVHGNGPQVGQVLIQMEEAATKVPPAPVDVAVAQTEGGMGYILEMALRNRIEKAGLDRDVSTVLSLVVVDGADSGFRKPSKPIGPFFSNYRAQVLQREQNWVMVEDSGRGWRKVVASPKPLEIVGLSTVRRLLAMGQIVIAGGGGGIPVVQEDDGLRGVEAVIDKDRTSALFAKELGAQNLVFVTGVDRVYRNFGKPDAEAFETLTVKEAMAMHRAGEFPPGSMGPKIESALDFVRGRDGHAVITDLDHLADAVAGTAGTRIIEG